MNKKLLIIVLGLIIALPIVVGCTLRTASNSGEAKDVPHPSDVRFSNCLACHAVDMVNALPHHNVLYANEHCSIDGCHVRP